MIAVSVRSRTQKSNKNRALLLVLQDAVDLIYSELGGRRPACRSDAGPAFAVAQSDFPSPTIVVGQLNDGVFNSLVFHPGPSALRGRQIRRYGCTVCSLVYLAMRNGTEIRVSTSAPPNTVKAGRETTHHFKTGRSATPVNFTLTKLHQHRAQMRRNRSSAGPAVA